MIAMHHLFNAGHDFYDSDKFLQMSNGNHTIWGDIHKIELKFQATLRHLCPEDAYEVNALLFSLLRNSC
jgi:hypothetical protein